MNPPKPNSLRRRLLVGAAVLAAVAVAAWLLLQPLARSWTRRRQLRNLNVILITIDTLRADYVGAYGARRAATPTLDALAAEGVRFDRCISQTPLTLPSHTTILSATYPLFHRVRDNGAFRAPEKLQLLSEALHDSGFSTAAFIGAYVLHGKWGLNQGFDLYSDRFDMGRYGKILLQNEKRADEVLADARRWIDRQQGRRFFAWIHLYDPHSPYNPPAPFAERDGGDPYRGEVEYCDNQLGGFIEHLKESGLYDRSLIVVAGDHGEGLGDHGEMEHGYFIYEPTVHVPLIVRAPAPFASQAVGETVQLVDVAPTVLDLVGGRAPSSWQGRSLRQLMDGRPDGRFGQAFCETWYPRYHYGWSQLQALYDGRQKYILAPRDELYDLAGDPGEAAGQATSGRRGDMRARLMAFINRYSRGALLADGVRNMSAEDQKRLAALGYLSGIVRVDEQGPLADPKDKLPMNNALAKATTLVGDKAFAEAVEALRRIVAVEPNLADAWSLMGNAYLGLKQRREALDAFRRALALKPDNSFLMLNILNTMSALGEDEAALRETERFLGTFPGDAALLEKKGFFLYQLKRYDEALAFLRQAVAADPGEHQAFNLAGETLLLKKDLPAAETILRQGLRENPQAKNTRYLLAQVLEARGQNEEAMGFYRQELEVNPDKLEAAYNLANLLKQAGQADEAARYYRRVIAVNDRMKLAFFHLADIMLKKGEDLRGAVDLCLKGIAIAPRDRDTLFGYFVLTNLYAALGDQERYRFYTREGEKLIAALGR